ncbi:Glutamyl-tRNA(Gln) amidotransferase subunit B, mitochondrial [Neolecta irregularis DAH-3]|uniref:Glutamyl-tRNA(Gln) amidotransferase subunit B, mitochondrial n=1 Tax=Neolecta irregularis (strain DAH-3) TaxID=1198029 RepID=A0A1U7LT85_NEOID|nr:Glutamyl-tRNA(Gln) amidotransferase subunit B, mitochondrial [Neolecta irregularis DAH-3]|eukprot:OLL25885.1 Glutamyl-tRNA(Gln) amidotransferase subunit B, mitochondrial [Neolecta irregularis DAH-3]
MTSTSYRIASSTGRRRVPSIGLELHFQLSTLRKLFSPAPKSLPSSSPNSNLAPFDAGLPGSQPQLNLHALVQAVRTCLLLKCDIQRLCTFDRKHYFYPDSPNGYQITQHYHPIGRSGSFDSVCISQVQLEQDTAKTIYSDASTLIDYNRSGNALVEIVTTPTLKSAHEASAFIRSLQRSMKSMGISQAAMDKGSLRVDVNVSVSGGGKVEIKNLASVRGAKAAIEYEVTRQTNLLEARSDVFQETRGFDGEKTFSVRMKETSSDYRYMPDPDIPPVYVDEVGLRNCIINHTQKFISRCKDSLQSEELPESIMQLLSSSPYNLPYADAKSLLDHSATNFFKEAWSIHPHRSTANWIIHDLCGRLKDVEFNECLITPSDIARLIQKVDDKTITAYTAKTILAQAITGKIPINDIILQATKANVNNDLGTVLEALMKRNKAQANQLSNGEEKIVKWWVGTVMRELRGRCKVEEVEVLVRSLLGR